MAYRNKKLLASAEGQACTICGSVGTTVSAHANSVALGKGVGIKVPDFYVAHLCQVCHDLYDGRRGNLTKAEKDEMWIAAYLRTVARWFNQGLVDVT